ncbi:hypothetical protein FACS1894109_19380 [Spirochaetia bacterium]|nr:hypothetical protein FACS1894109_19380 [Spirochaetia bacterium]
MNHRNGIFFFLFLCVLCAAYTPGAFAQEAVHVVEKDETIYGIARSFKVSPEELMIINDIADASKLQVGKKLRIPGTSSGTSTVNVSAPVVTYIEHRVVRGETLYSIARNNGITLAVLRSANNFSQDYVLKEGDRIRIPVNGMAPSSSVAAGGPRPRPLGRPGIPPSRRRRLYSLRQRPSSRRPSPGLLRQRRWILPCAGPLQQRKLSP